MSFFLFVDEKPAANALQDLPTWFGSWCLRGVFITNWHGFGVNSMRFLERFGRKLWSFNKPPKFRNQEPWEVWSFGLWGLILLNFWSAIRNNVGRVISMGIFQHFLIDSYFCIFELFYCLFFFFFCVCSHFWVKDCGKFMKLPVPLTQAIQERERERKRVHRCARGGSLESPLRGWLYSRERDCQLGPSDARACAVP